MKKARFAVLGSLAIIILSIMGGCANMEQLEQKFEQSAVDQRDILLAHMEEKYGVKFLPISYAAEGYVTIEEFRCYAEGTDRERDYVSVFVREENGEEVIVDDYFGIMVREEYQNRVDAAADAVAGDARAYVHRYNVSFFDNALAEGSTLDDAIAMGEPINATKYIYLEADPGAEEAFEDTCDRIVEKLQNAGLPGIVIFYGLARGELQNITESNYLTYLPNMINPDGKVCLMSAERLVALD